MTSPANILLAIIIVYLPYQLHFPIVFDLKGINFINLLFFFALLPVLMRKEKSQTPTPIKWNFFALFGLLFMAFLVAQARDGSRFADDLTTLKAYIFYPLFYFLYFAAVRDVKTIRFLMLTMLFVTAVISLQTMRQGIDYGFGEYSHSKRAAGPFGKDFRGSNAAAAYFVIFVPLFVAAFLQYRLKLYERVIVAGAIFLGVFATFVTYSRQAYIILSAVFFLHAMRRSIVIAILIVLFVSSYEVWAPATVITRIQMTEMTDESGEKVVDESTASRFLLWEGGMQMLGDNPLGVGLAHFPVEIGKYVPEYSNFDPHNGFVLITAEAGFLAVPILLFLFGGLFALGWRLSRFKKIEDARFLGGAYMVAVVGVIASNLFGSRLFNGEIMGNFWILSALVARYLMILKVKTPQMPIPPSVARQPRN
jgi:O-Antigen ligase